MPKTATLSLTEGSRVQQITLDEVKQELQRYVEMTSNTGQQLGWSYARFAFPYEIVNHPEGKDRWFLLKGKEPGYRQIVVGVNQGTEIEFLVPDGAPHGDVGKANEYVKFLGKSLKAQTRLFNGRIIHYDKV